MWCCPQLAQPVAPSTCEVWARHACLACTSQVCQTHVPDHGLQKSNFSCLYHCVWSAGGPVCDRSALCAGLGAEGSPSDSACLASSSVQVTEGSSPDAAFQQPQSVKATLWSQVKLLKCLVDNIVVDISFDTLNGLCTVAFLEAVDRHVGREHLFKRSIILVRPFSPRATHLGSLVVYLQHSLTPESKHLGTAAWAGMCVCCHHTACLGYV